MLRPHSFSLKPINRYFSPLLLVVIGILPIASITSCAPISPPLLQIEESLQSGDALSIDGSLYDEYQFEAKAGQAVVITLESEAFDTLLFLFDVAGKTIAISNDANGETNSQIGMVLSAKGKYRVWVTAFNANGQGSYGLAVTATTADDPVVRQSEADRLNAQGVAQLNQANYPEALALFQQALAIRQDINDRRGVGESLNNIGGIYDLQGKYLQALDHFQRALAIQQDIGNLYGVGVSFNNIGSIYDRQGDYPQALESYQQALEILQDAGTPEDEGVTLNNIGSIYYLQGNDLQALDYLHRSLDIFRSIHDRQSESVTLNNIGFIHDLQGNELKALEYLQKSLDLIQDDGESLDVGLSLNNIGSIYYRQSDYSKALGYFQRALAISQNSGYPQLKGLIFNNLGLISYDQGDYLQALDYFQKSLAIHQASSDLASEAVALINIARWFEQQDQPTMAIIFLKQGVNVYEAIRTNNREFSLELQQSYTATVEDHYRILADMLLQQNRVLEAQRVIDLLKVQELDDALRGVRGEAATREGIPLLEAETALLEDYRRIFQQGVAIAQELSELRRIPLADRTSADNERIFALEKQQSTLLDQFLAFVASPEVQALLANLSDIAKQGDLVTKLATDEFITLRNNLRDIDDAVLIYPLILEQRLELVLVSSSGPPTHYPIAVDEETLRDTVFEFQQALRDKTSSPEPLAQQLYDWLIPEALETALEAQGIETILYAPDGILRYVPLAALHDGEQWLIENYRINHITAASLTDLNLEPDPDPLVLAGAFSRGSHPGPNGGSLRGLPYAGVEVQELADRLPSSPLLLNEQFTLAGTAPLMDDHTIVHFATHAAFLVESPLQSFILFGNGDRLTLSELKGWRGRFSNVDLVVLSACETGIGNVRDADGEEILGFGYLMQAAGASAAMASLWPVSDGGTQVLMTRFYDYLSQGLSKAEALQQAQRSLVTGEKVYLADVERIIGQRQTPGQVEEVYRQLSHPYYWAPFILIGNGL
ncbi:MAG: tetratricopeptide repeat protein [Cyanobacteria bacterium J06639_14]